jgi:adenylate kinase
MIILITGTPGTGKTTLAKLLGERLESEVVHIAVFATGEVVESMEKGTKIVDERKLEEKIKKHITGDAIIDGHLSSSFGIGDLVIVLRTNPQTLEGRLKKKGFGDEKIKENLEAEALDVCLVESLGKHKEVFEIDTTDRGPDDVIEAVLRIIDGEGEDFRPGKIDWSEIVF